MNFKKNIIYSYSGQIWVGIVSVAFLPKILNFLGSEAYGLVGFFSLIFAWVSLLDLGITTTLNREMARFTAGKNSSQEIRNLLCSLELIFLFIGIIITLGILLLSSWLTFYWLKPKELSLETVNSAILIMAFLASLRLIEGLYRGAIIGLQNQIWLSIIGAVLATARWGGVIMLFNFSEPSINNFFIWQILISIISIILLRKKIYSTLPDKKLKGSFSFSELEKIKKFGIGMFIQALLTLLLTQLDKVILSGTLTLENFGYYSLAANLSAFLIQAISPIVMVTFPKFTNLIAANDRDKTELITFFHKIEQFVVVILVPVGVTAIFYSNKLLELWGADNETIINTAPLLSLLIAGVMINGLIHMPYWLSIAYGKPKYSVMINAGSALLLTPLLIYIAPIYGGEGSGIILIVLNIVYVIFYSIIIKKILGYQELKIWYFYDLLLPIFFGITPVFIMFIINPDYESNILSTLWILTSILLSICTITLTSKVLKKEVSGFLKNTKNMVSI